MKQFDLPKDTKQAGCLSHYFWTYFKLVQKDKTINIDTVKQQFVDFGVPVPEDTETLRNINVETQQDELGEVTFKWLKNNQNDIRSVYFGNPNESFE